MKKAIKILLSLLLIALLCVSATSPIYADTVFDVDGFSYSLLNDGFISIYDWEGGSDHLVIPNRLDRSYVREIKNSCFAFRDDFTDVDFSEADYLNRIGISAFKSTAITGVLTIPAQIHIVASGAFENCDNLEIVYYNSLAEVISSQCFYDCDSLREIYISDSVKTIESHAFSECDNLSKVVISEFVTDISDDSFSECPNLVIYCYTDSYAHQYAVDNGFNYVLIDAPAPTDPPTEPVTDAPTEPPTDAPEPITFMLGDADGDGMVTILDATKIQRILVDLDTDDDGMITLRSLVDGADTLNIMHATKIQRWIAGFKTDDPIGGIVTG